MDTMKINQHHISEFPNGITVNKSRVTKNSTFVIAASDSLHPEQADYVCDGTADEVEIQSAIDALPSSGGKVILLDGTFVHTSQFTIQKNNVKLEGQGDSTILDFTGVDSSTKCIRVYGEITTTNSILMADPSAGDLTITITNGELFTTDDWIRIRSEALFNGGTQHYGEIQQIESVAGNVLTLKESLSFAYAQADTATADLIIMKENIHISNFKMITINGDHNIAISFEQVSNVRIENITTIDFDDRSFTGTDVCTLNMTGCTIKRCNRSGLGYGLTIVNASRDIIAKGNTFYDCRHAIACGGDATYGVQTNQVYTNNISMYNSRNGGMFGQHNSYIGMIISNNTVSNDGLGYVAGLYNTICGNSLNVRGSQGIRVISGAKYVGIDGNAIKSVGQIAINLFDDASYITISNNVIDVDGSSGISISEINHFNINSNMISNATNGIYVRNNATGCSDYMISDNHLINCTTPINDEEGTGTIFKQHSDLFMNILAVSATHVRSNEDLSAITPITYTIDAQPDVPRTLSWAFDSHVQITEYDMEVIGVNAKGNTVTETWDETAGWSGETSNAFATITLIKMTTRTGTGVADTMDIGITDVLGLSNMIYTTSDVFKIKKNNANATIASAQVNTIYDTYDMSVIGLAATDDFTIWYKSNLNIIS